MWTVHGDIVTPEGVLANGTLTVSDDGRIGDVSPRPPTARPRAADIDARGLLVLPGFLDMHVHGGGGADFMHGTPDAARAVARTHARFGTTGALATTLTASREDTDRAIGAMLAVQHERGPDEARLLGLHLEGPFICPARRGAQPAAHVRPPDPDELAHWLSLAAGQIRQITLAPELPGAEAVVRLAASQNVLVSVGHTDATADVVALAAQWGARQGTHVFNAMTGVHHRTPGAAAAILALPELVAEVVADGVHLHPLVVRLIINAKGINGAVLVTDAMEGAAMPDGLYELGGVPVRVRDGTASFADGTLAGSVLTMSGAFQNARAFAGLAPWQASRLASANAARQLGLSDEYGSLEPGKSADLVVLDPACGGVAWTIIGGRVAYRR